LINYKLIISYSGSFFLGFQQQSIGRTVEGELLNVISKIFGDVTRIVGSGRTDTGVHALGQVVNFKSKKHIDLNRLKHSLNRMLPIDLSVLNIEIVDLLFNSRHSATNRIYHYLFSPFVMPPFLDTIVSKVDINCSQIFMNKCSQIFLGTHDFSNFRKKGSDERSTIRTVSRVSVTKEFVVTPYGDIDGLYYFSFQIEANSFLYRMVRNIVGSLFQVFMGNNTVEKLIKLRDLQEVDFNYSAVPAKGLSLVKVCY
jgi:tRNA pseudouridine38-40 synthase